MKAEWFFVFKSVPETSCGQYNVHKSMFFDLKRFLNLSLGPSKPPGVSVTLTT